jgi:type VI secretion system protein ImpG
MDDRYYTEEINYLLELGREFARQHPQKARMLHFDDVRSRDPNVERLLESFAFLTSRIRKRLDDDFPQIADGLLSLMWPGYINPVPSFSLLEFRPASDAIPEVISIPKGVMVDSESVLEDIQCRFQTCFDITVLPLEISNVAVSSSGSTSKLVLSFLLGKEGSLSSVDVRDMKVQLVGEFFPTWQIYDLLLGRKGNRGRVEKLEVAAFDAENQSIGVWQLGAEAISPVGLTRDEVLLPSSKTSLWSFSLLKEFFTFPEKYQAFRLGVLHCLAEQPTVQRFDVSLFIDCPWPSNLRLSKEQFRLNTVPIVNLFSRDATPIALNRLHHHYTVRGDLQHPEYFQVYSVDSVESVQVGTNKRTIYSPLYTSHSRRASYVEEEENYFSLERRTASWGGWETFISFVDSKSRVDVAEEEIVSLSLTCTNGRLPSKLLPEQIRYPVSYVNESLVASNITHPTAYILPDIEKISLWRWLSHAALNYLSIKSKEQLQSLLTLHDFSNSDANRHKIEGIKAIRMSSTRTLFKGALIPGIAVNLGVKEENFTHLGEIQLFANIMSQFISSYASINSYVQVSLDVEPSDHKIAIQPCIGSNFQL